MALVIWPVVLFSLTHNVSYIGYFWALRGLSQLVLGPLLGWLIDTVGVRTFLFAFEALGSLVTLAMSYHSPLLILVLAVGLQAVEYALTLAPEVAIGLLSPDEESAAHRNAVLSTVASVVSILGPILAAVLTMWHIRYAVYSIAAAYLLALMTDATSPRSQRQPISTRPGRYNWVIVGQVRALLPYILIFAGLAFVGREVDLVGLVQAVALWPHWAQGSGLGPIETALAVGGVLAGLGLSLWRMPTAKGTLLLSAGMLVVLGAALGLVAGNIVLALGGLVVAGAASSVANIGISTRIQRNFDNAALGRAFGVLGVAGNAAGSVAVGALGLVTQAAGRVTATVALSTVALLLIAAGGVALRSRRAATHHVEA